MTGDGKGRGKGEDSTLAASETPITVETDGTLTAPPRQGKAAPAPAVATSADLPVVTSDHYELRGEIARGGMGRISLARDRRLGRPVAIKEILAADPDLVARFEREARITARLQHPAIVNLYEAGRWPSGEPFFAMKMVTGRSLKDVVASTRSLDDRLPLLPRVLQIAEALAYAHGEGVVHRDLKPANVLVGDHGETVVIDWGLAKDMRAGADEAQGPVRETDAGLTMAGAVMGTPGFMAPEQAEGLPIDERADVYALGAILYYVLTGEAPYRGASSTEILTALRRHVPVPITDRVPGVPPDLAAIVSKAMARDRGQRYRTADELAGELRAFQAGQLVKAHHYSRGELVRRWVRRHRGELLVAALFVAVGVVALGESVRRIVRERDRAEASTRAAIRRADELTLSQARQALEGDPRQVFVSLTQLSDGSPLWGGARLLADEARRRGLVRLARGHQQPISASAWHPGTGRLVTGDLGGQVWIWERGGAGRRLGAVPGAVEHLTLSPDGRRLASVSSPREDSRTLAWWDLMTPAAAPAFLQRDVLVLSAPRFVGDDVLLVGEARGLYAWNLGAPAGGATPWLEDLGVVEIAATAAGDRVALIGFDRRARVLDVAARRVRPLGDDPARAISFSPGGRWLALARNDGTIELWESAGNAPQRLTGHREPAPFLCWLDEDHLATGGEDHDVRIWSLPEGSSEVRRGHTGPIRGLACADDGERVASASHDGTVRVWPRLGGERTLRGFPGQPGQPWFRGVDELAVAGSGQEVRLITLGDPGRRVIDGTPVRAAAFSPDGKRVVTAHADETLQILDLPSGTTRVVSRHSGLVTSVGFAADGRVLTTDLFAGAHLWDPATGESSALPGAGGARLELAPDGRRAVSASASGHDFLLWDLGAATGEAIAGHTAPVYRLAWSGGDRLVSSGHDGGVRLWDLGARRTWLLAPPAGEPVEIAAAADGRWVAAFGPIGGTVWHLPDGQAWSLGQMPGRVEHLGAGPDGQLVAGFADGRVAVWTTSGSPPLISVVGNAAVVDVAVHPAGERVAVATRDEWVVEWELRSGERRALLGGGREGRPRDAFIPTRQVRWSPDGRHLLSAGGSDEAVLWWDDLPETSEALRAWLVAAAR